MTKTKKNVVLGIVGNKLDKRKSPWRPTIHLVQSMVQKGFSVDRFHLLYQKSDKKLAEDIQSEIETISLKTKVQLDAVNSLAWDYLKTSQHLFDYVSKFPFDYKNENYYIHLTTGTDTVKNCWVLLLMNNILRAEIIQSHNPEGGSANAYTIVNTEDISLQFDLWKQEHATKNRLNDNILTYQEIFSEIQEIVQSKMKASCFLLLGETGTGKTQLVQDIAKYLKLNFVEINCACLIRATAMSELCGHKKGAFTGASHNYEGKLKQADGGILFLDEISELGLEEQAMLLKILDGGKVDTLAEAENKKKTVSFHLFCATNKDLDEEVANGSFRGDLLSRINLWQYHLTPLRERKEELKKVLETQIEENKTIIFDEKEKQYFLKFALAPETEWLGNWRDFNNMLARIFIRAKNKKVTKETLDREITELKTRWSKRKGIKIETNNINIDSFNPNDYQNDIYYQRLCEKLGKEKLEQQHYADILQLLTILRICKGKKNAAEAGRKLYPKSINHSSQMGKFLKKFGLEWELAKEITRD
ncbi:MAG: sigma 54-interacting transcriptional regulator [Planctomycetaceae bacterium]|jgi:transcriptional regulatory protein RtcR|nr:sigma 54-interacting transcriptional regulator [Planctomycetaceae bacterium]